LLNRVKSQQ